MKHDRHRNNYDKMPIVAFRMESPDELADLRDAARNSPAGNTSAYIRQAIREKRARELTTR